MLISIRLCCCHQATAVAAALEWICAVGEFPFRSINKDQVSAIIQDLYSRDFLKANFRPWKATQLYHETKDPMYVKQFLGHKCLKSTEVYINIERSIFESSYNNFTVKVAENPDEIKELLENGFEYVCQKDNLIFLKKRK
jgi:hypothetical protein